MGDWGHYRQSNIWNNEEDYANNPYSGNKEEELCESCVDKIAIDIISVDGEAWPVCQECKEAIETSYTKCECGNYTDYDEFGTCEPCQELDPDRWGLIVKRLSENG